MIPGVDFAGRVTRSTHKGFAPGDLVVAGGCGLGEAHFGGLAQKARVSGDWLVPLPPTLSPAEAMAIGTAGVTAMFCVLALERFGVTPALGTVVVTGAWAVSAPWLSLYWRGWVGASPPSRVAQEEANLPEEPLAPMRSSTTPNWPSRESPLRSQRFAAGVDTVGSVTLANVLARTQFDGAVDRLRQCAGHGIPRERRALYLARSGPARSRKRATAACAPARGSGAARPRPRPRDVARMTDAIPFWGGAGPRHAHRGRKGARTHRRRDRLKPLDLAAGPEAVMNTASSTIKEAKRRDDSTRGRVRILFGRVGDLPGLRDPCSPILFVWRIHRCPGTPRRISSLNSLFSRTPCSPANRPSGRPSLRGNAADRRSAIADFFAFSFSPRGAVSPEPSFQLEDGVVFAMLAMGGVALMPYFRDRGWQAAGGLLAALAFAFGGSASWRIQHTGQVMSLAWLPGDALAAGARARPAVGGIWRGARGNGRRLFGPGARSGRVSCPCCCLTAYALFRVATDEGIIERHKACCSRARSAGVAIIALPLAWTWTSPRKSNRPAIDLDGAFKGSLPAGLVPDADLRKSLRHRRAAKGFLGTADASLRHQRYLSRAQYDGDLHGRTAALAGVAAASSASAFSASGKSGSSWPQRRLSRIYALGRYTPLFAPIFHVPGVDLWRRPPTRLSSLRGAGYLGGHGLHLVLIGGSATKF